MKNLMIFITLLLSINYIYAQKSEILYHEDFTDNSEKWEESTDPAQFAKVTGGAYLIKTNETLALRWFGRQVFIDYREDFKIYAKMKQIGGFENQGYGIVWGSKGWEDSFFFSITSSGYFNVGTYNLGEYADIKEWTKSSAIKGLGTYNDLLIEKSGINLNFYINDTKVYTCDFKYFKGQLHGFMIFQNVSVLIDEFKVTKTPREIEVASHEFSSLTKKNLGSNVNSQYSEIAPIISPDGNTLFVGRIYHPKNTGTLKECDIWYSEKQADGSWGKAKNIGYPINNEGVNVVITVTPDGNSLLLEGLYNSDGSHKSEKGISLSYKTDKGWSIPQEVKVKNYVNHNIYETYCLTNDRSVLILAIQTDDTYGDMDLYVSFKQADGSYSEPKNMGPILNTFAGDGTPFLAQDNTTLYFSSYGQNGYGSSDIFMTKRLDDTWLNWSKPKNLGTNINTADWDTYFSLDAEGKTAYFVSTSGSYGQEDIFELKLEEELQPDPVVLIYGKVLNDSTGRPIAATITYEDLSTSKEVGVAQSDPLTGEYKIVLPYGKKYGFRANATNYLAENENIDLTGIKEYKEIERNLKLVPFTIGETIVLNNIFFAQASAELLSTSNAELDRLVELMKKFKDMEIEIGGHTDNIGDAAKLLTLSEQRAEAVKKYLITAGIAEKRITAVGYGGTKPLTTADKERAKNRRVEFKIIKK